MGQVYQVETQGTLHVLRVPSEGALGAGGCSALGREYGASLMPLPFCLY